MPETRSAAVVLAAGASTRLGQAKQLVVVGGESLLRRTVRLALEADCAPVIAVLGHEAERMRGELTGLGAEAVMNPEWREGMGASVRCGVSALQSGESGPGNILLLVCDQPRLTAEHLRELLARHGTGHLPITASQYAGRLGVPAVFAEQLAAELLQCRGDQGAREVIRRDRARVQAVSWPEGGMDIDEPGDLADLT
ncbi:MAG TPA: nucleotidyltransferase family protein [Acidobacteriaceae bacterium]|jgi:molybdenum cofactor cytidylyltransferase